MTSLRRLAGYPLGLDSVFKGAAAGEVEVTLSAEVAEELGTEGKG
jgi:hypothetical protein